MTENVLVTQEIIRDINGRNKMNNVVVKLDMTKTYDRESRKFLVRVLRSFEFVERIIDMIVPQIRKNWYSVLINGYICLLSIIQRTQVRGSTITHIIHHCCQSFGKKIE